MGNIMGCRVARHDQPRAIPLLMKPEFPVAACRIIPKVEIIVKIIERPFRILVRPVNQVGIAKVDKLLCVAGAK